MGSSVNNNNCQGEIELFKKIENLNMPGIERKFSVLGLPENLDSYPVSIIKQGYLRVYYDHEDSIRRKINYSSGFDLSNNPDQPGNVEYSLNLKSRRGAGSNESTMSLLKEQFDHLWQNEVHDHCIEKTRHYIPVGPHEIKLDIFAGKHQGNRSAEINFTTIDEADSFELPAWLGEELSGQVSYNNSSLALHGWPGMEKEKPAQEKFNLSKGIEHLVNNIDRRLAENPDQPVVVLIAGGSCSGKSEKVAKPLEHYYQSNVAKLAMDDYYIGKHEMQQLGVANFDQSDAIDTKVFAADLQKLKNGQPVWHNVYDFIKSEPKVDPLDPTKLIKKKVEPGKVIVVEGLHALHEEIRPLGDIRVFTLASYLGRLFRRLKRDYFRKGQKVDAIYNNFINVVEKWYQNEVLLTKEYAGIVIVNDIDPTIELNTDNLNQMSVILSDCRDKKAVAEIHHTVNGIVEQYKRKNGAKCPSLV